MQIETRKIDDIKAIEINDHILAFYAGRDWTRLRDEPNWLDDGAMKLGLRPKLSIKTAGRLFTIPSPIFVRRYGSETILNTWA